MAKITFNFLIIYLSIIAVIDLWRWQVIPSGETDATYTIFVGSEQERGTKRQIWPSLGCTGQSSFSGMFGWDRHLMASLHNWLKSISSLRKECGTNAEAYILSVLAVCRNVLLNALGKHLAIVSTSAPVSVNCCLPWLPTELCHLVGPMATTVQVYIPQISRKTSHLESLFNTNMCVFILQNLVA